MKSNYPLIDDLVERVYDVAIAPEHMEQLVDVWMERLRGAVDPVDFQILVEPGIASHVQRAERVLRELIAVSADAGDTERDWVEASRAAALVVNRSGVVVAANHTAQRTLGVVPGNTLSVLPLAAADIVHLTDLIEHIDRVPEPEVRLLRLRKLDESASILMRIVEAIGGDPDQIGLVTSIVAWPDKLSAQLMATFQLSQAEADVVKHLTLGFSVKEIAERTRRSEATIRTHVSALLQKTGARTQLELVRLALGMLDVVDTPALITPLRGPPGIVPEPNHYNTLALSDGRTLDYLVIGDPRGRPFLMLPTDMGFTRLPPQAEAWLQHNRMRMIVPVRAGYGHSSPLPLRRDAFDVAIADMTALSDFLDIERCPILAFCDDFHLAVSMACKSPDRISAIVGVGPVMPANQPKHFQRFTFRHTFQSGCGFFGRHGFIDLRKLGLIHVDSRSGFGRRLSLFGFARAFGLSSLAALLLRLHRLLMAGHDLFQLRLELQKMRLGSTHGRFAFV